MSDQPNDATMDAYHHLSDRKWRLYICSDCDPAFWDEEDGEAGKEKYDVQAMLVVPEGTPVPDFCPRCNSYLSLCESSWVTVTHAARKQEEMGN